MRPRRPSHLTNYTGLTKAQLSGLRRSAEAGKARKLRQYNQTLEALVQSILEPVETLCKERGADGQLIPATQRAYLFATGRIKAAQKYARMSIGGLVVDEQGPVIRIHGQGVAWQLVHVLAPVTVETGMRPDWQRAALWVEREEVAA